VGVPAIIGGTERRKKSVGERAGSGRQWPRRVQRPGALRGACGAVYCVEETTMTLPYRIATLTMVLVLLIGGPLAPLTSAQTPSPTPDVFKETMKSPVESDPPPRPDVVFDDRHYDIAAGFMTAFLVPGRAITCLAGGVLGTVVLLLTFGSGYRAAAGALNEGCGGKWIVRGEDLVPDRPGIPLPTAEQK
jgi:hypothetical protein